MYEEIKKKAKKRMEAKMVFYIIAMAFAFSAAILFTVSFIVGPGAAFWLRFTILIMALILMFLYTILIGIPFSGILSKQWQEEEVEKEMVRLYHQKLRALPPPEELTDNQKLELKELEKLSDKWEDETEEYV